MSYKILVVDDSDIIRAVIKKTLGMSGLEIGTVYEASNGQEALKTLKEEWIDIVFTDINMPVMNGIEFVKKLSQDNLLATVPVVVISTERRQARIEELNNLGIKAYINKPFRPENFRSTILNVLGI